MWTYVILLLLVSSWVPLDAAPVAHKKVTPFFVVNYLVVRKFWKYDSKYSSRGGGKVFIVHISVRQVRTYVHRFLLMVQSVCKRCK